MTGPWLKTLRSSPRALLAGCPARDDRGAALDRIRAVACDGSRSGPRASAKRVRAGQPETGMLAEAEWIAANAAPITGAVAAAPP
jgi:hypothetical protein